MSENYSEDKREKNKPDEEVGTSQGPHQTDPSEDKKALDRFSEAQLRGLDVDLFKQGKAVACTAASSVGKGIHGNPALLRYAVEKHTAILYHNGIQFREVFSRNSCTKYCNLYGKDLAKTGADLKRTVLIDDRTQSFLFQDLDQHAFSATVNREPTVEEPNMDNIQEKLLNEFFDLFDENIGTVKNTRATLHVKPRAEPKTFNAKRIAFQLKKPVEAEVQRLVKEGMSESVDPAATPLKWATPVVCIDKRNGNVRICGNFRATINPNLLPESHLLPIFEELTTKLVSGQEFSTIDLKDAFLQMLVDEKSQKYPMTHIGYFQYKRLPFGITSAPAIYKSYRIYADGIHPTMERVEAIAETTSPKNVKERRTFLGAELVTQKSSLVPYDPKVPLVFTCDASERGLGAGLFERFLDGTEKPIAFAPQTPSGAKNVYAPIDREALALLFSVRKFHQYVYGRQFLLMTDHRPLTADANREPYTVVNREIKRINMTKLDDLWLSEKEKFEEEHKKRIKPDLNTKRDIEIWKQKMYQDWKSKSREFRIIGEEVWIKNELNRGWSPGITDHQKGKLSYEVLVAGKRKRKHADQHRKQNGALDEKTLQYEVVERNDICTRFAITVLMAVTKVSLVVSVICLLMGGSADGGCPVSSTWDNYGGRKLDDGGCLTVVDMFEVKKFYGQVTIEDLHRFCASSFKGGKLLSFTDSQKLQMLDGVNFKQAVASNILIHPGVRIFENNITMKKNVHVEKCGQTERLSCDGYPYEYISNGNGTVDGMLFKCAEKGCCNNTDCDERVSVLTYESTLLANFPDLSHDSYCRCLLLNSTFLTWNLSNDHIYDCDDMKCDVFICQNDEYTDCNETRVENCTYLLEAGDCKEFTYEVISEKEHPYGRDCEERNYGESCLCPCAGTWTEWSIVSQTCGKVVSNRYRPTLDMVSEDESCDGAEDSCCKETKEDF
ncbi:conserved hypothetical protein, partial [Trichinella spiralis]